MEIIKLFKLEREQVGYEYGYERSDVLGYYRELKDARYVMNLKADEEIKKEIEKLKKKIKDARKAIELQITDNNKLRERIENYEYTIKIIEAKTKEDKFEYLSDDNDVYYNISNIKAVEIDGKIYEINEIKLNEDVSKCQTRE